MKQPNIIIILAEDISTDIGCYGDPNAVTPNLDAFAEENIRFSYCSSAAPVCSAARTSLALAMYGSTAGVGQHRSERKLPENIKVFAHYLREAGYLTAIGKTDFNFEWAEGDGYDMMMPYGTMDSTFAKDTVKEVQEAAGDRPYFFLQTIAATHQSQYGYTPEAEEHRKSMARITEDEFQIRDEIQVPGYHLDTLEAREVWAQYQEKMTAMDRMFGEVIDQLKEDGLYEDTVIFFAGDNGHGIPQGKTMLWDEGVHVPFLAHIPEKYRDQVLTNEDAEGNAVCDRYVSFVDFGPTMLSLAGAKIPEHMQGNPFLGQGAREGEDYMYSFSERVDECFENSRCIREDNALYLCDFSFTKYKRPNGYQTIRAPWFVGSQVEAANEMNILTTERRSYFRQLIRKSEELFDLSEDVNQLNNIGDEPQHREQRLRMRTLMQNKMRSHFDDALMPEPMYHGLSMLTGRTVYDILRDGDLYPIDKLIELWNRSDEGDLNLARKAITDDNALLRLWAGRFLMDAGMTDLVALLIDDEDETVRAYTLYRLAEVKTFEASSIDSLVALVNGTENYCLLMFITDLIAGWNKCLTQPVFEALCRRQWNGDSKSGLQRYTQGLDLGLHMLSLRIGCDIPECDSKSPWKIPSLEATLAVVDLMDL